MRRMFALVTVAICPVTAGLMVQPHSSKANANPVFSATANPLTFDFVAVGQKSATKNVTITNVGGGTLGIKSMVVIGRDAQDFKIVSQSCVNAHLMAKQTCAVNVSFTPTDVGTRVANIRLTDDTPCHDWINLAGSGAQTSSFSEAHSATCESGGDDEAPVTTSPAGTTVTAQAGIALPTTCVSKRKIQLHLTAPGKAKFTKVKVNVAGRTFKVISGKKIHAIVDLTGLPRARFTLTVKARLSTGKSFLRTHHYVTCVASKG